jgi:aminoglycoside 3-N-acetyltransferase
MKGLNNMLRPLIPAFLLEAYRDHKKNKTRKTLENKKKKGQIITVDRLVKDLRAAGIQSGDTLLVHCAMSKIGYLEQGPKTLTDALFQVLGKDGNLLMPSSPNASFQIEYARRNPVFDVLNTPSKMGAISEYFRKLPGVKRSAHPTEPVCASGPDAEWLTNGHFGELTPYTAKSPWRRMYEREGKILYLGVTLDNAGTHLHTLEDAVDFKYPVYAEEIFSFTVIDEQGKSHEVKTKVHNPEISKKRQCDGLLPLFEREKVAKKIKIGEADSWLFDGKKMFACMIENYRKKGITMYTPNGETLEGF